MYIREDAGHHFVRTLLTIVHGCYGVWNGERNSRWVCYSSSACYLLKTSLPREIQIIITPIVLTEDEGTYIAILLWQQSILSQIGYRKG